MELIILEGRPTPTANAAKHCPRPVFTPEEVERFGRMWASGASISEMAAVAGMSAGSFSEHRRYGQLAHLPTRQGRGGGRRHADQPRPVDPTPAEIAERAAAIRRTWVGYEHGDSGPPGIRCIRTTDLGLDR